MDLMVMESEIKFMNLINYQQLILIHLPLSPCKQPGDFRIDLYDYFFQHQHISKY